MACKHTWIQRKVRVYWPIRLKLGERNYPHRWLRTHGWELGATSDGSRIYGWTLHLGRLKVCFGPKFPGHRYRPSAKICPNCKGVFWAPQVAA